jgi:site-specific recombinase
MKLLLLKIGVFWRRLRHGTYGRRQPHLHYEAQVAALMRRANPFATWNERANWIIDVAEWLRREQSLPARPRHQRMWFLLDWLDGHRDARRLVRTTLQKTLREASGHQLFSVTGLPSEPAFFSGLVQRLGKGILPRAPANMDLAGLFTAMFPRPDDAEWLRGLDRQLLARLWKLAADEGITHAYQKQIDEALTYLVTLVIAVGISPPFRQRLGRSLPLQATPFMALRRELEKYLLTDAHDRAALRSVRMLVAVCQAQTDKIYAHLDEYGVSMNLVYQAERMRAQLARIRRLIDLRATFGAAEGAAQLQAQALLGELIAAHHQRSSMIGPMRRSFALLARKMVERNAEHGELYRARDRGEYRSVLKAAAIGGAIAAFAVLGQLLLNATASARFFEGASVSVGYAAVFLGLAAAGGVLAACQPAVTVPALAARMGVLDTLAGLRGLLGDAAFLLRAQTAALVGNLATVIPVMGGIVLALTALRGTLLLKPEQAHATLQALSLVGPTPLFAIVTGVLLWLAGVVAGVADNWFALRRLRRALSQNRRLVHVVGATRAERGARWLERNLARIVGAITLALLLGMTPVVARFFDVPLDVRHVTLAAATLVAACTSLGWSSLATPEFWLAAGGVGVTGVLNIGAGFACALGLALAAREVPKPLRRLVLRALLRRMLAAPGYFLLPSRHLAQADDALAEPVEAHPENRLQG